MQLSTELVRLPLRFDADRLAEEVGALAPETWRPHPQAEIGNTAAALVARDGDPSDDAAHGAMRPTPTLAELPYVRQVLAALGTVVGRSRLMRIDSSAQLQPHADTNHYWREHLRVHVPVVTHPEVLFRVGEREAHLGAGETWVFDTWRTHGVRNDGSVARIHLVVDTVGTPELWDLIDDPGRPERFVPYEAGAEPPLLLESVNRAPVMTPWEQAVHAGGVLDELRATGADPAAIDELAALVRRFRRAWRAAWAVHGDSPAGAAEFAALRDAFDTQLVPLEARQQLPNGVDVVEALRQLVVRPAVDGHARRPTGAATAGAAAPRPASDPGRRIEAPVFIVSSPRSGSSLLFETMAQSPTAWTIGTESHQVVESIPQLNPANRGWDSNRLSAADVTDQVVRRLEAGFLARLRDRDGNVPPDGDAPLRLLEKTPKNALRVPFLAAAFPDARFVYLYRDPRETLSSMLDAWRSGRFRTYPNLPGWGGPPWSLLLVPGWRELIGMPLAHVVAQQWVRTTTTLLDDLEGLAPDRWCAVSYGDLVADPQREVTRLCRFLGLDWDRELQAPLPVAAHTVSAPDPEKWKRNAGELQEMWPAVKAAANRSHAVFASPPETRPARRPAPAPDAGQGRGAGSPAFRSVHSPAVAELLERAGSTLAVSTYQSGRLILVRARDGQVNTHFRFFRSPMGIAAGRRHLAIGTKHAVWRYVDQPAVAAKLEPAGSHDACFLPRGTHITGDIRIHELVEVDGELWAANTRFSCLSTFDAGHSFVPRWRPPFVTALAAEDRCHLNGIALRDGDIRYVTALGVSDEAGGWRERKADGGVVLEVPGGEVVAHGLSMPHSPRWHDGRLWVLESGKGEVNVVDLDTGRTETVAQLPGFTRGLAFVGPYALVGLSQVRESVFGGIPLAQRLGDEERQCGIWLLDTRTGATVGLLRFESTVQEIFDVQVLAGIRWPELVEPDADLVDASFVVPDAALAEAGRPGS